MTRKTTVLISGATGFIGNALSRYFQENGIHGIGLTRQNCDYTPKTITELIKNNRPDIFIHAAGNASVAFSHQNPDQAEQDTVLLTKNILQGVANAATPIKFIHLSSAAVYGNLETLPISENATLKPISPYGHHKLLCEQLVSEYARTHGFITPVIVRIFSLFGAAQRRLVLYELFSQFQDSSRQEVLIKGTGLETRDYLSIDIFVKKLGALLHAISDENPVNIPHALNIAAGRSYTILEGAQTIGRLLNSQKPIICAGEGIPGNPDHWLADTTLYNQIVKPIFPFDFEQELAKTLDQWKSQETA